MDAVSIIALLGSLIAILGTCYGIYTNKKKNDKEEMDNGRELGSICSDLGYIKSGIDDIKRKQDIEERDIASLRVQVEGIYGKLALHGEKLTTHDTRLNDHSETLDNHESRISKLEGKSN